LEFLQLHRLLRFAESIDGAVGGSDGMSESSSSRGRFSEPENSLEKSKSKSNQ
jgi:hypothetical protein